MSDLADRILRKSIGSMRGRTARCDACRRTPVAGEYVHRLATERTVCSLCLTKAPARQREGAVAERVHASERHLRVAPRAA